MRKLVTLVAKAAVTNLEIDCCGWTGVEDRTWSNTLCRGYTIISQNI